MTETDLHVLEPDPSDRTLLLEINDLRVGLRRGRTETTIVDGVSFDVDPRTRFGIVGESGSGKSMTLRAIAGLLPGGTEVLSGSIRYRGTDLVTAKPSVRRGLMGPEIAMIFQEPMTALNPVRPVGDQIAEGPRRHLGLSKKEGRALALEMMGHTGIPDPVRRVRAYPHELSGGLRQRVMIAMALACRPKLLLCDEPTTALDVTVQHQVLDMLESLCAEVGAALVFVTHDLAVVNKTCSDLAVMYAGRIVESGRTSEVLANPRHPYTRGLLDSAPDFDQPGRALVPIPGLPPSIANRPPGCAFAPRCSRAVAECDSAAPILTTSTDHRTVACFRAEASGSEISA
ncbi:ABC transporter ATP-binding protein [Flexivirga endophytica]|uniref:ABC transporter ATP-binding protein n=1 Tax=Flexivirga endophytica TaxID=1849103 RepID=A0A916WQX1_9MICO|nr:ABC transporter ATP-binding protein [Flexivirga endophytica]GGB26038.1 ABC transporter ATP-binding protein [Flexivirga endophytica]GHB54586.1 ABC transporter ATP-binding protein [Flexivirga endophytica]